MLAKPGQTSQEKKKKILQACMHMSIHGTLKNYISTTVMSTKQITYIVMTVFLFLIGIWVEQIIKTERGKTQFYRDNCEAHLKKKKKNLAMGNEAC